MLWFSPLSPCFIVFFLLVSLGPSSSDEKRTRSRRRSSKFMALIAVCYRQGLSSLSSSARLAVNPNPPRSRGNPRSIQPERGINRSACLTVAAHLSFPLLKRAFAKRGNVSPLRRIMYPSVRSLPALLLCSFQSPPTGRPSTVINSSHRLLPTTASFLTGLYATYYTPDVEEALSHQGFYGASLHHLDLCLLTTAGSIVQECCFARFPHEVFTTASLSHYAVSSIDGSSQNQICGLPDLLVAGTIVQECGLARFTSFIITAIPSHYAVSNIDGSSQSQLRDLQTGAAIEKGQLAPPLPCVLIPTSRRNTPKSSARRLDRTETLCLIPDDCLVTLIRNECDDIIRWSISVTNYWLRHGNVEVRGFDSTKPFSLSSNSIVLSVLMKTKLAFEIHLVSLRSFVEFKTDHATFNAKSSHVGLSILDVAYGSGAPHRKLLPVNISIRCINVVFDYQLFTRTIAMGTKMKLLSGSLLFAELDSSQDGFIFSCFVMLFSFVLPSSLAPVSSASVVNFVVL